MGLELYELYQLINPDYAVFIPLLLLLGAILKHTTKKPNDLIPIVLVVCSVLLCSTWGFFTSPYEGLARWFAAFFVSGIAQGVLVASTAITMHASVHGASKYNKRKKEGGTL